MSEGTQLSLNDFDCLCEVSEIANQASTELDTMIGEFDGETFTLPMNYIKQLKTYFDDIQKEVNEVIADYSDWQKEN